MEKLPNEGVLFNENSRLEHKISKPLKNIVSEIEKINKKKPINELKKRGLCLTRQRQKN
jgi:hypothetical protein